MNGQQQMLIEIGKAMGWKHDNRTLDACFTRPDENFSRFFNPLKHPAHRDELTDYMLSLGWTLETIEDSDGVLAYFVKNDPEPVSHQAEEKTRDLALTRAACLALGIEWRG